MSEKPFIAWLRTSVEAAKSFAAGLFTSAAGSIVEMEETKADKGAGVQATIPASEWALQEGQVPSGVYPYCYDLAVDSVTALDRAAVTVSVASLSEAALCGLCPTCETADGNIRLWSASKPGADITVEYWIEQGAEPSHEVQEEGKE